MEEYKRELREKYIQEYLKGIQTFEEWPVELPVPRSEFQARIRETQRSVANLGYEGLLVFGSPVKGHCIRYLTNYYNMGGYSFRVCGVGPAFIRGKGCLMLIIPTDGEPTLLVTMAFGVPREEAVIDDFRVAPEPPYYIECVENILKEKKLDQSELGLVEGDMPITIYRDLSRALPNAKLYKADHIVEDLRAIKSLNEQKLIREAAKLADRSIEVGLETVKEGVTEAEIAQNIMNSGGARCTVLSGPRWSAMCLRYPRYTNRKIRRGEMVLIDSGAYYKGYRASIDRTTAIAPSDKQKKILEIGLQALEVEVGECKPGIKAEDFEKATGLFLTKAGYAKHHTLRFGGPSSYVGHAVGLGKDKPILVMGNKTIIKEGMTLAFEPGIYIPGMGGARLEDTCIVTKAGCEVLTKCPRAWW